MNRKQKPPSLPPDAVTPEHIARSRVMRRQRISKRGLPKLAVEMMTTWGPELVGLWFTEKYKAAKRGDPAALDDIAEVYGLIQKRGGGGPQFNVNVGGQMAVSAGTSQGYDGFMRQLHEARTQSVRRADSQRALPETPEAA
jgi:hypothetical protein